MCGKKSRQNCERVPYTECAMCVHLASRSQLSPCCAETATIRAGKVTSFYSQVLILFTFHLLLLLLVFLLVTCPSLNITLSLSLSLTHRGTENTILQMEPLFIIILWLGYFSSERAHKIKEFVSNYSASFSSGLISYERHPLKNLIIRLCEEFCSRRNC